MRRQSAILSSFDFEVQKFDRSLVLDKKRGAQTAQRAVGSN
jgi:hypothetical protein